MADETTLKIRLDEANTPAKLAQLQMELKKTFDVQISGSKEQLRAANDVVVVGNKLAAQRALTLTDNGKMMKSYFTLGQQLRQNKFAVLELAQAAGMDKMGLGGIFMAFTGGGGLLAGMIAGTAAFGAAASSAMEKTKALKAELRELRGDLAGAAAERLAEAQGRDTNVGVGMPGTGFGIWVDMIFGGANRAQQAVDIQKAFIAEKAALIGEIGPGTSVTNYAWAQDAEEKTREREMQRRHEGEDIEANYYKYRKQMISPEFGALRPKSLVELGQGLKSVSGYGTPSKLGLDVGPSQAVKTMEAVKEGAISAGSAITQYIGGALRSSLNDGQNLALTLVSIGIQTAMTLAGGTWGKIAPIFRFASGGSFTSAGPGFVPMAGGGMAMVHPNERIDVTPMRNARLSRGGGGGGGVQYIVLDTRLRSGDIYLSQVRGSQMAKSRTL